jgi:Ca2+-binding RTX toxin-like protein/GH24 family phage-related lysozyme (muramidase)
VIYKTLTQQQYVDLVITLISSAEGPKTLSVIDIGDGKATIGFGYTFDDRDNNLAIWQAAGISLTPSQITALKNIDAATTVAQRHALALQFDHKLTIDEAIALLRQSYPKYEGPADTLGMPLSSERAAFVSLTYNRGPAGLQKRMAEFYRAIQSGDRAEAWFQMRYNSWGTAAKFEAGLRGRRLVEAELFGLYDSGPISLDEAKSIYRMYTLHRARVLRDESNWGINPDGTAGKRNLIDEVNGDSRWAKLPEVSTITEALQGAENVLVQQLSTKYAILSNLNVTNYRPTDIYLNPQRASASNAISAIFSAGLNANGSKSNSILIGGIGNDTLLGGTGSDILIAGVGDDLLVAGTGNDTLIGGIGHDTMVGNKGCVDKFVYSGIVSGNTPEVDVIVANQCSGTIYVQDKQLTGPGNSTKGSIQGTTLTWLGSDGTQYQFSVNLAAPNAGVGTLSISKGVFGSSGGAIVIPDFDMGAAQSASGYLGLHFSKTSTLKAGSNTWLGALSSWWDSAVIQVKGTVKDITDFISSPSSKSTVLHIHASGTDPSQLMLNLGSGFANFDGDGNATVTIPANADSTNFGLVYTGDPTQSPTVTLTSTVLDDNGQPMDGSSSNSLTVTFDNSNNPAAFSADTPIAGDPSTFDATINGQKLTLRKFIGDNHNDVVNTSDVNNVIWTGNGNSSIFGGTGNDFITVGNGNNIIERHGGADEIHTGDGNNAIYTDIKADIDTAFEKIDNLVASDQYGGDVILGKGNNTVVGGAGNQGVWLGTGNNFVILGPGKNLVDVNPANNPLTLAVNFNLPLPDGSYTTRSGYTDQNAYHLGPLRFDQHFYLNIRREAGADSLYGGNDTIFGGTGDSFLWLSNGDDYLDAGGGNDTIIGGIGNATIFGGAGNDTFIGAGGSTYFDAESGSDLIVLEGGNNTVYGGTGNSTIYGGDDTADWATSETGNNYIEGGTGNTLIYGSAGNDTLMAGSGNDTIYAGADNTTIVGGDGNDQLWGGAGTDIIYAGDGGTSGHFTQVVAGDGATTVYGGNGVDHIFGGKGNDELHAGDGGTATNRTTVTAGDGNTTIYGGAGVDALYGGKGTNVIYAGDGGTADAPTYVKVGSGNTTVYGGAGIDNIVGGSGTNVIHAGDGGTAGAPTKVIAGSGNATVYGGAGVDQIQGGSGTDVLYAGDGGTGDVPTVVIAGSGNDTLVSGAGVSQLIGGAGQVTYQIDPAGTTTIFGSKSSDVIQFIGGTSPTDVAATAQLYDDGSVSLGLSIGGGAVTIMNGLSGNAGRFQFDGAGTLSLAQLMQQASVETQDIVAGNSELLLSGTAGDVLSGSSNNQTIYAFGSGSTLVAANGTSKLVGGGGNDVYAVNAPTSQTTITGSTNTDSLRLGSGVLAIDVSASLVKATDGTVTAVAIQFSAGGSITINGDVSTMFSQVTFSDGSATTLATLISESDSNARTVTNPDGSTTTITSDGHGNVTSVTLDANGMKIADSWKKSDGSSGKDTYVNGVLASATIDDGNGNIATNLYDAHGNETSDSWSKSDGSSGADAFNSDGSSTGTIKNANGTSATFVNDGKGTVTATKYDANGAMAGTTVTTTSAQGVFTVNYDISGTKVSDSWVGNDGSSNSDAYHADGSYTATSCDSHGNTTIAQFNQQGTKTSDTWTHADGSQGSDTFNGDGSSVGTSTGYSDGSSQNYTDDGHGNRMTIVTRSGLKIGDFWTKSDGTRGRDYFNPDGSSDSIVYHTDGSYSVTFNDGHSNVETTNYNAQGQLIDAPLAVSNRTSRTDSPDGSYKVTALDGQGNMTVSYYDSHDFHYRDVWTKADGSHGSDYFNADGSKTGNAYRADGTFSSYHDNGMGELVTTNYDWKGTISGSTIAETNGLNNVITTYRDAAGNKISETWTHGDGTSGKDMVTSLDFAGSANLVPPGANGSYSVWGIPNDPAAQHLAEGITYTALRHDSNNNTYNYSDIEAYVTGTALGRDLGGAGYQLLRQYWSQPDAQGDVAYDQFELNPSGIEFDESETSTGVKVLEGWEDIPDGKGGISLKRVATTAGPNASSPLTMKVTGPTGDYAIYTDDGQGNISIVDYGASGTKIGDIWLHNDDSYGFDVFNSDGSSTGVASDKDSHSVTFSNDGHGHVTSASHDPLPLPPPPPPAPPTPPAPPALNSTFWTQPGAGGSFYWYMGSSTEVINGQTVTISYWPDGHMTMQYLGSSFSVDTDPGYSMSVTSAGKKSGWDYDASGGATGYFIDDGHGTVTTYLLDSRGRAIGKNVAATDAQGNVSTSRYDTAGNLIGTSIQVTDATGLTTTTNYDSNDDQTGYRRMHSDGKGNSVTVTYDAAGAVLSTDAIMVTAAGQATVTHYDAHGAVTGSYVTSTASDGALSTYNYDANVALIGSVIVRQDSSGKVTTANFDARGNLTSFVTLATDANSNTTLSTFNGGGIAQNSSMLSTDGVLTSTVHQADGSVVMTTRNADRTYSVNVDNGQGASTTTNYSAQDFKLSDTWKKGDGSHGTDTYHADGTAAGLTTYADGTSSSYTKDAQGHITTIHYAADGKTETGSTVISNNNGNTEIDTYDASGAKVGSALTNADGSSESDSYKSDGSHAATISDGQGGTTTVQYNAQGVKVGDSWTKSDGTSGSHTYNADGSYSSTVKDAAGNATTTQYNAQDVKIADTWIRADGTSGGDTYNADGSHAATTNDGHGNTTTIQYNAQGVKTADAWSKSGGSSGTDTFNSDGSTASTTRNADGTSTTTTDDGHGDTVNTKFNAQGVKVSDSWIKADGSHGTDTFNSDGSGSGTATYVDGSSGTTAIDTHGVITIKRYSVAGVLTGSSVTTTDSAGTILTVNFDAQGVKLSDSWTKTNGSWGTDTFNADGSSSAGWAKSDGTYGDSSSDGKGHTWSWTYAPGGKLTEFDASNPDGSTIDHVYLADGTSIQTNHGADGSVENYQYDANGKVIASSWSSLDGSHGSLVTNADGSSTGASHYADGRNGTYSADGQGNSDSIMYDANGVKIDDSWTKANGTSGYTSYSAQGDSWTWTYDVHGKEIEHVFLGADGRKVDQVFQADGSSVETDANADGSSAVVTRDANNKLVERSWKNADGSYGDQVFQADGSNVQTDHNADGSVWVYVHDANGKLIEQSWKITDGSYGDQTWSADGGFASVDHNADGSYGMSNDDGHGNTDFANFAADGTKLGENWTKSDGTYGFYWSDGHGTSNSATYDANGKLSGESSVNADGSSSTYVTNTDGTHTWISRTAVDGNGLYTETAQASDANGMYIGGRTVTTFDGKGDSLTIQYDATGNQTGETWKKADGSTGTGYGGESITASDGQGGTVTTAYNVFGVKSGDSWTKADGSHGTDSLNPDGSSSGATTYADGTSMQYYADGTGYSARHRYDTKGEDVVDDIQWSDGTKFHEINSYDANGFNTGDTWTQSDGSHGSDTNQTDGSYSSMSYNADGSWSSYVGDAHQQIWRRSDGTHGSYTWNADGSRGQTAYGADGSYSVYTNDGQNDEDLAQYDENGFKLSDSWHKSDGTSGDDTFTPPAATPNLVTSLSNQTADQAKPFAFTISADTFAESVAGDALTFGVTQVDGTALPAWLTFDAKTGVLSGTPDAAAVGNLVLKVTATDAVNGLHKSTTFSVTVNPAAGMPVVNGPIADQSTDQRQAFQFVVPASVFTDTAGNAMTYAATLADDMALPSWLRFDAATGTFSGTPGDDDAGTLNVKLTAADPDGQTASAIFKLTVNYVDRAPVAQAIADQATDEFIPFTMTLPADAFTDPDKGDTLTYAVTLADGTALPDWLTFNATTGTLSGTPGDADTGAVKLKVTATDSHGLAASTAFSLTVNHVNAAPVVSNAVVDQHTDELTPFIFVVPANTFADPNKADVLTLRATLGDGSALPAWLSFNAATGTFSGTPDDDGVGTVSVKVTATDPGGLAASTTFNLTVNHVNAAPVLSQPIADQAVDELTPFIFAIPTGAFTDPNRRDTLTYGATLADGSALPSWLTFNAATGTLSGTPGDDDTGTLRVKVTATDPGGLAVSDVFSVTVNHVDEAPVVAAPLTAHSVDELTPFTFVVPAGTFTDPNQADVLSYSATLADGTALPAWLTFDAATGTFTGTPGDADTGAVSVKVTATDPTGLAASSTFVLTVNHVNEAPVVVNALTDLSTDNTKAFAFVVPTNTFADPNRSDVLTYKATLTDGSALPSWLKFDPSTGTFSGIPAAADAGVLAIVVTATDPGGLSASAGFKLTVDSKYASPVLNAPLLDQTMDELTPFRFAIPAGTFTDPNAAGKLSYSAALADGKALPSWLTFNAATGTFTGTPGDGDIGTLNVKVTATDSASGLATTDTFSLTVGALDTLYTDSSIVLPAHVHNLAGTGTADLTLTGNALDNVITANDGNDTLVAGTGVDTLVGGKGNDTFVVNNINDVIVAQPGSGIDTVLTSVSYVLPANVQNITGTGSADLTLQGNDLGNVITANGGNDTLIAGSGPALLIGGAGNNTFVVNSTSDVVQAKTGGVNTILTSASFTASANVRTLTGTGNADVTLTGNDLNDVITANDGNDTLIAGSGIATLVGGQGNDTFVVNNINDVIVEGVNSGNNTVLTSVSYVLPANVQNITGTGNADLTLQGNDLGNIITANSGNDTLIAGSGPAFLIGGAGNDMFVINNVADVVQAKKGGVNTIQTSVSFTASANVKNLTGTGNADITLTGNDLANVITANSGNDTLVAGSGVATLIGGAGNDTFVINNASDVIVESPNAGNNTVMTSVSYVLPANVQNITGTGTADLTLTGNGMTNVITANDGNDTLIAGSGIATLVGGAGNDTFVINNIHDVIVENPKSGIDTVKTSVSYTLSANLQNLAGTGTANLALTGNDLANVITANGGNDTLTGGIGNDTLIGGVGGDTYVYSLGDGLDTIVAGSGKNTIRFGQGLSLQNAVIRLTNADGTPYQVTADGKSGYVHGAIPATGTLTLTAHVAILDGHGVAQGDQGMTFTVTVDSQGNLISPVGAFQFADGSSASFTDMLVKSEAIHGDESKGEIITGRNDDAIYAGPHTLDVRAGSGNDTIHAGSHGTLAYGGGGNDYFIGGEGNDTFVGGWGTDVMQGGKGSDSLSDANGAAVMLGGHGSDTITGGAFRDFIAGGAGNDDITTGGGANVIAFNKGGDKDVIRASAGAANVLSLGGGINEADLTFSRNGDDLVLGTGGTDGITLKGWYANAANHNIVTLQVIEAASKTYDATSSNVLVNRKVETFDFGKLVAAFDQAQAANAKLTSWSLMNGLLTAHLAGSDTAALGGDLAYYEGMNGSLSGMNMATAVATVQDGQYGVAAQKIDGWSTISKSGNTIQ